MFGLGKIGKLGAAGSLTPVQRAINLLKSKGADAHLWDFSTLTGLYQDSAGTTPVTAPDQPIGLCLDSMGVLGSELAPASWSAYNATISGSTLPITATSTGTSNFGILEYPVGYVAGKKYKVSISWTTNSAEKNVSGDATGASNFGNAASGSATCYIDGDGGPVYAYCFGPPSIGSTLTITAYSLKEITGIHAAQSTSAKKPKLRRGIVNRLTYSGDFGNAAWSKTGVGSITYDQIGPTGAANSAATITTTTTAVRSVGKTSGAGYSAAANEAVTCAIYLRKTTGALTRYPVVVLEQATLLRLPVIATIDTTDGVVTAWTAYTGFTVNAGYAVTIVSAGDYWLVAASGVVSAASSLMSGLYPAGAATATQSSGTITGAIGPDVVVGNFALFTGTLTASEILNIYGGIPLTTSAPASSSQGRYWAEFDGTDDCLTLGSVPFAQTDDYALVAQHWRTDIAASWRSAANVGGSANGIVIDLVTDNFNSPYIQAINDAGVQVTAMGAYGLGAVKLVQSGHKVGTTIKHRLNGIQKATMTVSGSYLSGAGACIGAQTASGTCSWLGQISSVSAIKSTLTDAELLLIEKMAANKAGVSL